MPQTQQVPLILATFCFIQAQSITGSFTGIVTDTSGSVIPGAQVTVTNIETGIRSAAKSDASGNYNIPLLPRGSHRLEGSVQGFKRFVREGMEWQVQQTARIDIQLTVGELAESVVVTGDAARLETENATLSKGGGQPLDRQSAIEYTQCV